MVSFNSVVVAGHLARDPELRYTPQGKAVSDFTVAVNRKFKRQNGEQAEDVAFIDITVWDRMGEACAEYLKKGRAVLVAGHLTQDRWEDPNTGQKRSKLKVVAERVQFLGGGTKDAETPLAESALPEPLVISDEPAAPAPAAKTPAPKARPAATRR
jgi:single-strand DNA-binding protein